MEVTREIFRHFPKWMELTFYIVAFSAIGIFLYGFYRRYKKYRRGRDSGRFNNLAGRFSSALKKMATHETISKRDAVAGWGHFLIFWGFIVLLIGTTIIAIDHDFLEAVFGISILKGTFYKWFSLAMDVFGVAFIVGLLMMIFRRAKKPPQLDYARVDLKKGEYDRKGYTVDDKIFAWILLAIGITGFMIEGLRIAVDMPSFEVWSPVGWRLGHWFRGIGFTSDAAFKGTYWVHAVAVMAFIALIPFSKAMHMLVDFLNLMFSDPMSARRLPGVTEEKMKESMGYIKLEDFTWSELMDFDACTKCGRCHVACPARTAGTALSPRDIILDLRTYADEKMGTPELFQQTFSGKQNGKGKEPALAGGIISQDRLWSCTTCMACVEACPVGIDHLNTIVNLRRALVEEGDMEDMLQDTLQNLGDYGNSFGKSDRMRARWTKGLDFKIKDARKQEVEYLWFVGDYASFDARGQEISRKVATILHRAGVDFGILYEAEKNSGNDVRRVGEEGLYEMLAEENIETLNDAKFKTIFTTDPHSLNTIRNEYPDFGGNYTILHYTELIANLIKDGKIPISNKLNKRVTYHDPCYLGRYNGETENPRDIVNALGCDLVEMPRNRSNSFCCGAGGGRIWMDDSHMTERPSENRIKEALSLDGVDVFVVSCPKDYAMFTDAVKTSGNEGKIEVMDIIDLVGEAVGPEEAAVEEA